MLLSIEDEAIAIAFLRTRAYYSTIAFTCHKQRCHT